MSGFIYYGKSTETVISVPLTLVSFDNPSSIIGMERDSVTGDATISRLNKNEYGTIYNDLQFTYSLMKIDGEIFTNEEQVAVERWLTSSKYSSPLLLFDCDNVVKYMYQGKFIATQWEPGNGGLIACTFTFLVNGAYCYKHFEQIYKSDGTGGTFTVPGTNKWRFVLNCDTDEREEYIYPIVSVQPTSNEYTSSFTITNKTDSDSSMQVTTARKTKIVIDCQRNIVSESDGYLDLLEFSDLGWSDIGTIYWLRLLPGNNDIEVDGNVQLTISFDMPYKKIGGWLL